jgi:predicted nucleic acid-binding protein
MQLATVDTNVLVGGRVREDQYHEEALELLRGFDHRDLPRAVVLSSVLEESLNLIGRNVTPEGAVETLDLLDEAAGFEIRHVTEQDLSGGRRRFRVYDELSLTDAIITAWMDRNDVEYLYSFDDDFDAVEEVTRLDSPHDPYR